MTEFDDLDQLERELGPSLRLALRRVAAAIADDGPTSSIVPSGDGPDSFHQLSRRSKTVTMIDIEAAPTRPPSRYRWWAITAAAAAAVVLFGVVLLAVRDDETEPVTDMTPVATEALEETPNETAEEIAQGFAEAYGALDEDQAITYLADDADITALIDGFTADQVRGTMDELRLLISLLEAFSFRQTLDSCHEVSSSPTDTSVRCDLDADDQRVNGAHRYTVTFPADGLPPVYGRVAVFEDVAGNRWDLLGPAA